MKTKPSNFPPFVLLGPYSQMKIVQMKKELELDSDAEESDGYLDTGGETSGRGTASNISTYNVIGFSAWGALHYSQVKSGSLLAVEYPE